MKNWSSLSYKKAAIIRSIPDEIVKNAIDIASRLKYRDLPPIFTLKHLSLLSNVSYVELRKIVSRIENYDISQRHDNYRVFRLKKNKYDGKVRERIITVPDINTIKVQRWIHNNILKKVNAHECSFAFHKNGGILKAATPHCSCRWMIKVDITNYFESILESKVYQFFFSLGYQPLVAFELTRICTRIKDSANPIKSDRERQSIGTNLPYKTIEIGHLPQGAPTSPLLSNLCSFDLDEELSYLALDHRMNYTRYADDIIFSSKDNFDREPAIKIIKEIYAILKHNGYWPNRAKTQLVPPGARKIALGLLVDSEKPRLTKEFKKEVKSHVYYSTHRKIGINDHYKRKGFRSLEGFVNFLNGKLSYAYYVEPEWTTPLMLKFRDYINKLSAND